MNMLKSMGNSDLIYFSKFNPYLDIFSLSDSIAVISLGFQSLGSITFNPGIIAKIWSVDSIFSFWFIAVAI